MTDAHTPRRDVGAQEYLGATFQPDDRLAVLVRNRRHGETVQRITTAAKIVEPSFQEWLHFKNDREGFDIYVGMNPLKPVARARTKEDILSIRHLYVELDHDGAKSLASLHQSNLVPRPNYVLSTSPGKFQVVWRVQEVAQERAEILLRAMAHKFGGDPAKTDSTRVLRIPGFANNKYDEKIIVKAEQHSDRVHHGLDFRIRIDHLDSPYQPLRRNSTRTVSTEPRPLSQSEHDWAFAKRALARGADPEDVIRKIADFRADDESHPRYYAEHTLTKAAADLRRQSPADEETGAPDTGTNELRPDKR